MFAQKRFVISGAAGGVGLSIARLMVEMGASVALWDSDGAQLQAAAGNLRACLLDVDITDVDAVQRAMRLSAEYLGGIDGVIHCDNLWHQGQLTHLNHDAAMMQQGMVNHNLNGTFAVAYAAIPYLRETGGSLILATSTTGFYGTPGLAAYSASSAAILNFAQALRLELETPTEHAQAVHVGVLAPVLTRSLLPLQSPQMPVATHNYYAHSAKILADALVHALIKRRFLILPNWRSRLLYALSHNLHWSRHWVARRWWRWQQYRTTQRDNRHQRLQASTSTDTDHQPSH